MRMRSRVRWISRSAARPVSLALILGSLTLVACSEGEDDPPSGEVGWPQLGFSASSRFHNPAETEITRDNVHELRVSWSRELKGPTSSVSAVVGRRVFLNSLGGAYALDAQTGEILWTNPVITGSSSATFHRGDLFLSGRNSELGRASVLHRIDPGNGEILWAAVISENRHAQPFSSPVVAENLVIIGSASGEEMAVATGATFHGSLVAFDRETGEEVWRHWTAPPPFVGCGIWSTPSVDLEARLVLATTGNNYTGMANDRSDAIFAVDLDTGELVWNFQAVADDVFTLLSPLGPDTGFGANPILVDSVVDGVDRKMAVVMGKSGVATALDRLTGEVLWQTVVSGGSALIGGTLNGGASDGEALYFSGNSFRTGDSRLVSLEPATGEILWETRHAGWNWSPITVTDEVGFVSSNTDLLAFATETGELLARWPTPGTISGGPAIAHGQVFFGSGLAYYATIPGKTFYALGFEEQEEPPIPEISDGDDSFTSIYEEVLRPDCGTGLCHGAAAGTLSFTTGASAYSEMVGIVTRGPLCGFTQDVIVEPGLPDESLLLAKMGANGRIPCGGLMPPSGRLAEDKIDRIRRWIERGAPND